MVDNICEYTDKDETDHIPLALGEILAKTQQKSLLMRYYYAKVTEEDYELAEGLFCEILSTLDFGDASSQALAMTGIHRSCQEKLSSQSRNHPGAKLALRQISEYLGNPKRSKKKLQRKNKVKSPKVGKVPPVALKAELEKLDSWERSQYLKIWSNKWLVDEPKQAYFAMRELFADSSADVESTLYNLLYQPAWEFENNVCFDFLCRAHSNNYGWSAYMTDVHDSDKRWEFLKYYFPNREQEFFERSITLSANRHLDPSSMFVPIARGVRFFIQSKNSTMAGAIIDWGISFVKGLMANLAFPKQCWTEATQPDIFDLLLQRLIWPSQMVRERAATSIAWLLKDTVSGPICFSRLTNWLSTRQMESDVLLAILPILKAEKDTLGLYDLKTFFKSLPMTSVVVELLLLKVFEEAELDDLPPIHDVMPMDESYEINPFFEKFLSKVLSPAFEAYAGDIGNGFLRRWSFDADQIIKNLSIEQRIDRITSYTHSDGALFGLSYRISDAYKSSFVRMLQHFHSNHLIDDVQLLDYLMKTLPIELSLWKVLPSRHPKWWPQLHKGFKADIQKSKLITASSFKPEFRRLAAGSSEHVFAGLDGAMKPAQGFYEDCQVHIKMVAFGYRTFGRDIPASEEFADSMFDNLYTLVVPAWENKHGQFLDDFERHAPIRGEPFKIRDLAIFPIVSRNRDSVINTWQAFRIYSETGGPLQFGPNLWATGPYQIQMKKNFWSYLLEEEEIAEAGDWTEGITERWSSRKFLPHGTFIKIKRSYLDELLSENDLRLGFLFKIEIKLPENDYSDRDIKHIQIYDLVDVSNIILPH